MSESEKDQFNIIVFGATGVGKSSLINAVFGSDVVKSGVGKPITQYLVKIETLIEGIVLWDTTGIEAKDYETTVSELKEEIKKSFNDSSNLNDVPHLGWLCIDATSSRIEPRDIELVSILKEYDIPLIVVFTKVFDENEEETQKFIIAAKEEINTHYAQYINNNYVPVNSREKKFSTFSIKKRGLENLIEKSLGCLSSGKIRAANALIKAQIVNKNMKLLIIENYTSVFEEIAIENLTESKLIDLIKAKKSFSIQNIKDMGAMVTTIEKAIESNGYTCRVYTENRAVVLAAGIIPTGVTQLGAIASAVGIVAHNLATFNPDYEVGKNIINDTINVTYKK